MSKEREKLYRRLNELEAEEIGFIMGSEWKERKEEYNKLLNEIKEVRMQLYGTSDTKEITNSEIKDFVKYGY